MKINKKLSLYLISFYFYQMKTPRNKSIEKYGKTALKELPYYNYTGNLALHFGCLTTQLLAPHYLGEIYY